MIKVKNVIRGFAFSTILSVLVGASFLNAKNQIKVEALSGSGSENDPILITTSEELRQVLSNVDSGTTYSGKYLTITNDLSIELLATTNAKTFSGHLDGGGYTITLSTSATGTAVAMFNCVGQAGSVSNIVFNGTLSGVGQGSSTICRFNYGTISNITNNCNITSTNTYGYLGGIAAQQIKETAIIQNCVNNGTISGTDYVGGIVGNLRIGTVSNSVNKGNVNSSSSSCGGIVGLVGLAKNAADNDATINECVNEGEISGTKYVGGIVGNLKTGTVSNSVNKGNVNSSSNSCGGIVGLVGEANDKTLNATINGCVNEGEVSGVGQVGGIAGGIFPQFTCSNCSNYGNVSASSNSGVGGIAGLINSLVSSAVFSFTNCYSSGVINTTSGWAGGIFGYASSGSLGTINFNNVLSASKVVNTSSNTGNVGGFMAGQNSKNSTFNLERCQSIASITYSAGTGNFSTGIAIPATNVVKNVDSNLAVNDKDHGLELSDTTIALLRAIREFNCNVVAGMADIVSEGISNLTPNEINLLDLTIHYGAEDYLDTYYRSALYISQFLNNRISGSGRIVLQSIFKDSTVVIATICCTLIVCGIGSFLIIKKRKKVN